MNIFELRDGTFDLLKDGGYKMSPTAHALLWFLLFHGMWDRNSKWFSHVNINKTGQETLAVAVGRDRKSVSRGLAELEANGFIKRTPRRDSRTGNRQVTDIELTTPGDLDFCWSCRTRGHIEDVCPA